MHTIRRYANRKLYDTDRKSYITLPDLGELVRSGQEIQVIDHVTKADLTAQTFAEIIFVEEKRSPRVSVEVLSKIIRDGLAA